MPILQLADEVNIISCGSDSALGPKSNQLSNYLRFWGIKPKCFRVRKGEDSSESILKLHKETKSDLLVMGAYSRSRLRERVFGGVTDHMLRKANIPVLMFHK
jgi:nucleotide-binding universal stress UspA family protein